MAKITLVGAGSTVFAKNLLGDILSFPDLADSTVALFDIDPERLKVSENVARKLAAALDANPEILATTDRRRALDGADYVLCMIQVGGYRPATVIDFEIPKKYGLRQTIADTLGIGGIMRGLRTIPVLISICHDMEAVCPDALFLNYANPMAMNCWALSKSTSIQTVGLCHSIPHTAAQLASDLGLPLEEIDFRCAGINHLAFYLNFEHQGRDLTPAIARIVSEGRVPADNRVRYEMFSRLGYFVTESSEHFSEYVPWFIKRDRPDLIEQFNIPLDEYIRRCEAQLEMWEALGDQLASDDVQFRTQLEIDHKKREKKEDAAENIESILEEILAIKSSGEYGPLIIHSLESGTPRTVYANVPNHGLISNLPEECIVEVACRVDGEGLKPEMVGDLPPHLAALMQTNINVQALTVEAALTQKREHIYHAAMLDPHTAAELDLGQIWSLVDELIDAHGDWLPNFE